jgi:hypothetical protein
MFDWLIEEMSSIKTKKFFVVDGPASEELRRAVQAAEVPLPESYRHFVLTLGNAALYRRNGYYYINVLAGPRLSQTDDGEEYIQFGRTWISKAYFKKSLLVENGESPVFEYYQSGLRRTADGFEKWLRAKCVAARKRFKKAEWKEIETGPVPFTEQEQSVVQARRQFQWKVIGISPNGDLQFEIHNGSAITLPYLSIGVKGPLRTRENESTGGKAFLSTQAIGPGETMTIEFDCYKKYVVPEKTVAFELPDPEPEDRSLYWEFRSRD